MNLINGLENVVKTVKECIYIENCEDGLLSDVETIIPISRNDNIPLDPPIVWIAQHPTVPYSDSSTNLSHMLRLQTTFEFVCVEYDQDLEKADELGQNLATRVGVSIVKNFNKIKLTDYNGRVIQNVKFNTFYPVGEVTVVGKSEKVPATSIVFDFIHDIDWLKCIQSK